MPPSSTRARTRQQRKRRRRWWRSSRRRKRGRARRARAAPPSAVRWRSRRRSSLSSRSKSSCLRRSSGAAPLRRSAAPATSSKVDPRRSGTSTPSKWSRSRCCSRTGTRRPSAARWRCCASSRTPASRGSSQRSAGATAPTSSWNLPPKATSTRSSRIAGRSTKPRRASSRAKWSPRSTASTALDSRTATSNRRMCSSQPPDTQSLATLGRRDQSPLKDTASLRRHETLSERCATGTGASNAE
mmetsp:Transcript_1950/g.7156  ORF Transcript_1950/g.7156 Transcript_1950/m.7156 type:complete len:243 (-) Transcript_1950:904-1632(-)